MNAVQTRSAAHHASSCNARVVVVVDFAFFPGTQGSRDVPLTHLLLVPPMAAASDAAGAPGRQPLRRERILVVDDEDVLRSLASSILGRQGYSVVDANSPFAALEIAAEQPDSIDLIL